MSAMLLKVCRLSCEGSLCHDVDMQVLVDSLSESLDSLPYNSRAANNLLNIPKYQLRSIQEAATMQHAIHNSIGCAASGAAGTAAGPRAGGSTGDTGRSSCWQLGTGSYAALAPTDSGALQSPLDKSISTYVPGGSTSGGPVASTQTSAGLIATGWNHHAVHTTTSGSVDADAASGRSVYHVCSNLNAAEAVHPTSSGITSDAAVFGAPYMRAPGMSAAARSSASSVASDSRATGTFWANTVAYEPLPTGGSALGTDATDLGTAACTYKGKEPAASVMNGFPAGQSVSGFSEVESLL